ncbi:MAG: DinB family protein [Chloroflexi bacterium]|nr:DinB family protein [Chloroflexota bacterium]
MNEALSILKAIRGEASRNLFAYIDDLGNEEYLWEPVPGCWSVRANDGGFRAEWQLTPLLGDGPFTTIAARMWHLGARPWPLPELTRDLVLLSQFVAPYAAAGGDPWDACGRAADAISSLHDDNDRWLRHFDALTDDELGEPIGAIAGEYADSSYVSLIGHFTNEYVHHAAEVRLLRHLYRAGGHRLQ